MIRIIYRSGRYAGCIPNPRFMQVYRSVETPTDSARYRRVSPLGTWRKCSACRSLVPESSVLIVSGHRYPQPGHSPVELEGNKSSCGRLAPACATGFGDYLVSKDF